MKFVLVLILILAPFLSFSQEGSQDEAVIDEIQAGRKARQENLETIQKVVGPVEKDEATAQFKPSDLFNDEALLRMEKLLKDAKLSRFPPDEVRENILKAFRGNPLEGYLRTSPKLQDFIVDLVRDDRALVSMVKILRDKQRLKIYLYWWIGIMFASYYTRKLFISKFWKGSFRTFASLLFSLTITTITLSTFCLIFDQEMKPIITLIKKHL
jgi:hypothetical protein